MSVDLYIDSTTNDLAFDANFELLLVGGDDIVDRLGQTSSDGELVAQRLRDVHKTQTGEWFLDLTYGTDWLGTILGRNVNLSAADAELIRTIAMTEGVDHIDSFESSVEPLTRDLTVEYTAVTDDAVLKASGTLPDVDIDVT
jgi:hypothetical protein